MMKLVEYSGLELIHHSKATSEMIISAIENGMDKIFNCDHNIALEVVNYFNTSEIYD